LQSSLRGGRDAFVSKIDTLTGRLLWSTYFGGADEDFGRGVALDARGNVAFVGDTSSGTLPVRNPLQPGYGGGAQDGFFAKLETTSSDTIGVFRPLGANFFLRNSNVAGLPDFTVTLGQDGDLAVAGDWAGLGVPGFDKVGVFRDGTFILRPFGNAVNNTLVCCLRIFDFGAASDLPVAGDWDGDGDDSIGVYRPGVASQFFLRLTNDAGLPDVTVSFGGQGDLPLAGDWDGDGDDTIGVYRPSTGEFFLRQSNTAGLPDVSLTFGEAGDAPVVGDWDGDGLDTIGVFRPSTSELLLRNSNTDGPADLTIVFGSPGDQPLAGDWDGKP
jgi:hypothetical protein